MAFHRIALLLAFAFIAVASVNSTKCYKCNSLSWEGCSEPQDPKYHTFECSTPKEDPACVQITFVRTGTQGTARGCIATGLTCDDLKKKLGLFNIELKDCKICKEDLCNGQ